MKSIIQEDESVCYICDMYLGLETPAAEMHHIFGGPNRKLSEKYGLKVKLCYYHHRGSGGVHFQPYLMDELHDVGKLAFIQKFPELDFREMFGKEYTHAD